MTCTPIQHFIRVQTRYNTNIVLKGMTLKMQQSEIIKAFKTFLLPLPYCHRFWKRDCEKDLGWALVNLGPKPSNLECARCQKCDFFNFYSKVCVESFPTSNLYLTVGAQPYFFFNTTNIIRITVWYSTWYSMIHTGITSKTNLKVIQSCVEPLLIV